MFSNKHELNILCASVFAIKIVNITVTGAEIHDSVPQMMKQGTRIESDACQSYKKLLASKYMFVYEVFDPNGQKLRWLHTVISSAKSFIQGTYHGLQILTLICISPSSALDSIAGSITSPFLNVLLLPLFMLLFLGLNLLVD